MGIKRSDVNYKLRHRGCFSCSEQGFICFENKVNEEQVTDQEELELYRMAPFVYEAIRSRSDLCLWLVESPTRMATSRLKWLFPQHQVLRGSISGYLPANLALIVQFWDFLADLHESEPWNVEQPWAMFGLMKPLPVPMRESWWYPGLWSVDHVLRHSQFVTSLFVQIGWDAFYGMRPLQKAF